ncbi:MAG: ROK family protein [candidate division WOR-3 bacterium]|nr:ROK family protein [candidate division WOR-3 bacterium]
MKKYLLGVDLGGSYLRFVLAEPETGNINLFGGKCSKRIYLSPFCQNNKELIPTSNKQLCNVEKITEYIISKLADYLQEMSIKKTQVAGIGISVAGKIECDNTFIGANIRLKSDSDKDKYCKIDLVSRLKKIFSNRIKIVIENDATAAGIAQASYYHQKGLDPNKTFYVTISTGIGGGGPKRDLDEIGHILIDGYFPGLKLACGCGAYGCLETFASGEGVRKQAVRILDIYFNEPNTFNELSVFEKIRTQNKYDLSQIVKKSRLISLYNKQELTSERIFKLANLDKKKRKTDQFAYYLIETAADRLAKVLVSISHIHDIERFGLGGRVIFNNPGYLELIKKKVISSKFCEGVFSKQLVVEITPLGEYIADYGALFLVANHQHKKQWLATISKIYR